MYKAIKQIGDYKPGMIVPDELAKTWLEMYKVPQVELVKETMVEVDELVKNEIIEVVEKPVQEKSKAKKKVKKK